MNGKSESRQKRIKRIKRKLPASLLASFSLPVTLFLFGPFDLFAQNRAEFNFSLYDFLLPCVLIALVCGAVLSAVALFLRKKVYSVYIAILFWASVMLYVQGSYLNFGYTQLSADGVSEPAPVWLVVFNAAIWAVTLGVTVFLVLKFKPVRKKLKGAVALVLSIVMFMECVGVAAVSFGEGVYDTPKDVLQSDTDGVGVKMLTTNNMTTLSKDRNVVIFLVDRFDADYYEKAKLEAPELLEELDGFTYYSDHVSLYARTFPAVTNMLTGFEKPAETGRKKYFEKSYGDAVFLEYMDSQGYGVNVYTSDFYAYENAAQMDGYAQNVTTYTSYEITDKYELVSSMIAFSLYRYFPFFLKRTVDHIGSDTFDRLVRFEGASDEEKYTTDNKKVYEELTSKDFTLTEESGRFTFLHIDGCHGPSSYGADFSELEEQSWDTVGMMTQSFKIINRYINEMKRLGVYENATVIITGDHAAAISDSKPVEDSRITAFLLKPSGSDHKGIKESRAQTCHGDIWRTVFASEKLMDYPYAHGENIMELGEDTVRERRYIFHRIDGDQTEEIIYEITGSARDFSNWKIVSRRDIPKIYK